MECGSNKSTEAWLIARMRREFYNGTFLQCLTRQHRCHWGSSSHRRQTEPDVGPLSYQENAELQLKHNLMVKSHVLEHRWFSTQACSLFSEGVYPGTRQSITSAAVKSGLPGLVLLFCRTRCQTTTNMNAPALPAVPPVRAEPPEHPSLKITLPVLCDHRRSKNKINCKCTWRRGQRAEGKWTWPDVCFQAHDSAAVSIFTIVPRLFLHSF